MVQCDSQPWVNATHIEPVWVVLYWVYTATEINNPAIADTLYTVYWVSYYIESVNIHTVTKNTGKKHKSEFTQEALKNNKSTQ